MSDPIRDDPHPAAHSAGAHPAAEEDRIHTRTIVAVGVGALIVFFVASLATIGAMRKQQSEILPQGAAPLPADLGKSKIGLLEQRLFENSNQAESMRATQFRKLETYGWVDAEKGVVRIPISEAMGLVLKGERPEGEPSRHSHGGGAGENAPAKPGAKDGGTRR